VDVRMPFFQKAFHHLCQKRRWPDACNYDGPAAVPVLCRGTRPFIPLPRSVRIRFVSLSPAPSPMTSRPSGRQALTALPPPHR
jgi:hypothetical protein